MAGFSVVLNPLSDPLVAHTAQLDLSDAATSNGVGYRTMDGTDFPPPAAKPAYASSYDTEGSVSSDEAHYDNREITLKVRVVGSSASNLETKLNALYKMVGQINREAGSLKLTTPAGTVCYFDLEREGAAATPFDRAYANSRRAEVTCTFAARPFWRGAEVDLGSVSETSLPALVGLWPVGFDSPDDIPGLERWYRGSSLGADTTAVSTWSDESGNASHATQGTGSLQPLVAANAIDGQKAVRGDGTDDFLGFALSADATRTIFIVTKQSANTSTRKFFAGGTSAYAQNSGGQFNYNANQAGSNVPLGGTCTNWSAVTLKVSSTASMDGYVNGGGATNFDPNDSITTLTAFKLLSDSAGASNWNGDVAEVIIYDSALSDSDRLKVLGYLSAKYPTLGAFGTAASAVSIDGDVPGLGRLVITDTESGGKDRWIAIVGGQSRYYNAATASTTTKLFYEAEALTATATSTLTAGATGASGAGSNVVRNTDLTTTYQAILKSTIASGTASLTHKGTYRIWARLYRPTGNTGAVSVRLEWAEGDYTRVTQNIVDTVSYAANDREGVFTWANLGIVSLDPASTRWEFRLLAKSTVAGDEIDADCFFIAPTEVVYTELSGKLRFQNPSVFSARDEFDQVSGALVGKTAPVGGLWTGGGDAQDFSVVNAGGGSETYARRWEITDTAPRVDWLPVSMTDQVVQCDVISALVGGTSAATSGPDLYGVTARVVDASNFFFLGFRANTTEIAVIVGKYIAGVLTEIWKQPITAAQLLGFYSALRLHVDAAGRWFVWWWPATQTSPGGLLRSGNDAALATGGTLASGRPGMLHYSITNNTFSNPSVQYNNFLAFAPTPDAAIFGTHKLTLGPSYATREDSTGSFSTKVSYPGGRYLKVPPAGPEGRSTRLAILALPNDPYTMGDAAAIYDLSAQLFVTSRGLVIPEA